MNFILKTTEWLNDCVSGLNSLYFHFCFNLKKHSLWFEITYINFEFNVPLIKILQTYLHSLFITMCVCSALTPLRPGRARLFGQRVQEEGDGFVHLVHADPPQHLLQEGQGERVVVSPPAVASHWDATWWRNSHRGCECVTNSRGSCSGFSERLCLTVDPPEDVEGGPLVCVGGQGVPEEPHPHCRALRLGNTQDDRRRKTDWSHHSNNSLSYFSLCVKMSLLWKFTQTVQI